MRRKWSERLLTRERIQEFAVMVAGPTYTNDRIAKITELLYAVCNEQADKCIADGRARAERKVKERAIREYQAPARADARSRLLEWLGK